MNVRRLHIGALKSSPGWESLNSQPLEGIDHVCDARNLSRFAEGTFDALYASHVLEHFDYRDEVASVLMEWFRVLAHGGKLYVSVPDLETICRLYCDQVLLDANDRFMLMRMIMGGHCDQYDYHHAAFNQESLVYYLAGSGFDNIRRCAEFNLFDDTSGLRFMGELISLNLIAEKPFLTKQTPASLNSTIVASQPHDLSEINNMTPENLTIDTAAQRYIDISIEKVIKLHESGFTDQAVALYADILSLYPDNDEIMFKLARLYQCNGHEDMAIPLLQDIGAQSPYYADALQMLGKMLGSRRDFAGGVDCLTRLLELDDSCADRVGYYNDLARYMVELGRPDEAYSYLTKSIQLAPNHADTYNYLGNLFVHFWRLSEAGEQYQKVIELRADFASAYSNLAWIATLEGRITDAVALYRTALELNPDFRIAADNLLFTLNYSDIYTPEQVRDEHLRLAERYDCPDEALAVKRHQQGEKIKVGYVSPDFKAHSVAFFFEPVLTCHNRANFEIFCYDTASVPDETTSRMMNLGWEWRTVYGLSDNAVAAQVRADGIDILVDLAGHTKGNRLGVFALRPAPIQVTWLGYPNTTGLKQIDFRLTDELADPSGMTDQLYAERLVRLPRSFLCYIPPIKSLEVDPLPEGPIIFCCFNNYPKISDTILHLWARVLCALPGSLLSLKNGSLCDAGVRDGLIRRFAACGIDQSRLILSSFSENREEHLRLYGACHIALDTYPYNGTTTTCEALWMGVPVVTLAGNSHASRVGASLLVNVGLPELVAKSADEYVNIALALSQNRELIMKYRHNLRNMFSRSPLADAPGFTADLERSYQWMIAQLPLC